MSRDISEIRSIRRKLGLTQSDLAKKSGVSQSLIAKMETGKLDPTYSNVLKIFEAIDSIGKKHSLQAKDFIHEKLVFCEEDDLVRDIIKKMKKYEISQLPVIRNDWVIGAVSESKIIECLLKGSRENLKAKDVMYEAPPIVSLTTEESVISNLLKFFSMVLVQDKGKLKGIITRSDILRKVYG